MEEKKPYLKEKIGLRDILQVIANLCIIYIAFSMYQSSVKSDLMLEALNSLVK